MTPGACWRDDSRQGLGVCDGGSGQTEQAAVPPLHPAPSASSLGQSSDGCGLWRLSLSEPLVTSLTFHCSACRGSEIGFGFSSFGFVRSVLIGKSQPLSVFFSNWGWRVLGQMRLCVACTGGSGGFQGDLRQPATAEGARRSERYVSPHQSFVTTTVWLSECPGSHPGQPILEVFLCLHSDYWWLRGH